MKFLTYILFVFLLACSPNPDIFNSENNPIETAILTPAGETTERVWKTLKTNKNLKDADFSKLLEADMKVFAHEYCKGVNFEITSEYMREELLFVRDRSRGEHLFPFVHKLESKIDCG